MDTWTYGIGQRARANDLTVCYRKKHMDISFSYVCYVIHNELRHNIVKVVCGSTQPSPHGSTATLTNVVMKLWSITGLTHEWTHEFMGKTDINLLNGQGLFFQPAAQTAACSLQFKNSQSHDSICKTLIMWCHFGCSFGCLSNPFPAFVKIQRKSSVQFRRQVRMMQNAPIKKERLELITHQ